MPTVGGTRGHDLRAMLSNEVRIEDTDTLRLIALVCLVVNVTSNNGCVRS